jgi:ferredoxin-NADP reductase
MSGTAAIPTRRLQVKRIIHETAATKSFEFECLDGPLEYKAGQFLTFLFKSRTGHDVRRSYSLSSCPQLAEPVTVTVKRIANGEFSRMFIEKVSEGDHLHTIGASGFFILPENISEVKHLVFFAAGSGIVPEYALIKTLLHFHSHTKILLVYSNRSVKDTIFHRQLHELKEKFAGRFDTEILYSISQDLSKSHLNPESIELLLYRYGLTDYEQILFYVCGPMDYMRMIVFSLTSFGVPPAHIRREIFHVQQPAMIAAPPDTKPHSVTIVNNGRETSFTVQYPLTILQAARLSKISIPYSCEIGQCGTCVAKCLEGQVWMARNEVLLDEEVAAGNILTCTGFPVNGDVTLKI